jgi:hypothetical protein
LEPRSVPTEPVFPSRLDTLIKCPLISKWTLDDTLYLSSRGAGRTLTVEPTIRVDLGVDVREYAARIKIPRFCVVFRRDRGGESSGSG